MKRPVRFTEPDPERLSEAQRAIYATATAGLRGKVPAPLKAWVISPEMAEKAQSLGEFARYKTALPPVLSELAILVTARHWTSYYEWFAHKKEALRAGLGPDIVAAIAARRMPEFEDAMQSIVYEVSQALHEEKRLSDALYQRASDMLGRKVLTELIGVLGYYTFVAMTLNVFEIGIDDDTVQELGR